LAQCILAERTRYLLKLVIGTTYPRLLAIVVLSAYAAIYLFGTVEQNVDESKQTIASLLRRIRR
jgi:hypothetical protein